MQSTVGAVKEAFTSATGYTAKTADLQKNTVDPAKELTKGLTTDQGVLVSDTDNWCVMSRSCLSQTSLTVGCD